MIDSEWGNAPPYSSGQDDSSVVGLGQPQQQDDRRSNVVCGQHSTSYNGDKTLHADHVPTWLASMRLAPTTLEFKLDSKLYIHRSIY